MTNYSELQQRVLDVVKAEAREHRRCALSHAQVAKRAGVGKATVRTALEKAERAGELLIVRRQADGDTNLVRLP